MQKSSWTRKREALRFGDAWRALMALRQDPDDTGVVFELIRALSGGCGRRAFLRFQATPTGQQILDEKGDAMKRLFNVWNRTSRYAAESPANTEELGVFIAEGAFPGAASLLQSAPSNRWRDDDADDADDEATCANLQLGELQDEPSPGDRLQSTL